MSEEDKLYKELEDSNYSGAALDKLNDYYSKNANWVKGDLQSLLLKRTAAFATAAGGQWRQGDYAAATWNGTIAMLDTVGTTLTGTNWDETAEKTVKGIATGGAFAILGFFSKTAGAKPTFVASSEVSLASQGGWRAIAMADLTAAEAQLMNDVAAAGEVNVGRSINVTNRGGFVLDTWLQNKNIPWTQRWQDVYNKALYERTAAGKPVNVMSGGGYSRGESMAAEAGARQSGIKNNVYWPSTK